MRERQAAALCLRQLRLRESQAGAPGRAGPGGVADFTPAGPMPDQSDARRGRTISVRAAVDVMGGDRAPDEILKGCFEAAPLLDGDDLILLVGDEKIVTRALETADIPADKRKHYQPLATTQVIEMDEPPVDAIRAKPDSSIAVMCKMVSKGQ